MKYGEGLTEERKKEMLINLWVRDKRSGKIHQVGTDVHDSVVGMHKGTPVYYNLQNGDGTPIDGYDESAFGYEWVEPQNLDDYVSVTPDELRSNRERIHNDLTLLLCKDKKKREENVERVVKAMFEKTTPDLKEEIRKILDGD
jgi:hypothetical protein